MKAVPYDFLFHVPEENPNYLNLPAFFECLAGLNLNVGVFSDFIEPHHFDVMPLSEMVMFLGKNNADYIIGIDSMDTFRHAQANCNVLWFLGTEYWNRCEWGMFRFHAPFVDSVLCTSHWQSIHVAEKLGLNSDVVFKVPPFGNWPVNPPSFCSSFRIVPILLTDADAVLFERKLRHRILNRYEERKLPVTFDPVYSESDLHKISDAYIVLIPSQQNCCWLPIINHCRAYGIPVVGFGVGDMHYNHAGLIAPRNQYDEFASICFMDDLTREQASKTLLQSAPLDESKMEKGIQRFVGIVSRCKFRSQHKIRYPQTLQRDFHLDRIWLHVGTGIGDMLIASAAFKNFKMANPGTELCLTVKENDEGGKNRGRKVFENVLGGNPYIDRVEFLQMEKGEQGYGIAREQLIKKGIDPNLILSVDLIPNFLMRNRTESSILDEVFTVLNVIPEYHQELYTDDSARLFGEMNSGKDTVVLCFEGSPVHEGRTTLPDNVAEDLLRRLREWGVMKEKKFVMVGVGSEERQKWCEELGDVSFYNKTRIREDIELIRRASFVISVDTGIAHIAMTLRIPFVGIYSEFNFPYWVSPYYRGLAHNRFVVGAGNDLAAVSANQIEKAVRSLFVDEPELCRDKVAIVHTGDAASNLLLEPAIRKFEVDNDCPDIALITLFPHLWQNNPHIHTVVHASCENDPFFYEKYMKDRRVIVTTPLPQDSVHNVREGLSKCLGMETDEAPNMYLLGDDIKWAQMFLQGFNHPIVTVHCFPDHVNRCWSFQTYTDRWSELITMMVKEGYTVVVLGVPPGIKFENCIQMPVGEYSSVDCISVLALSDVFVGIDGFYAHVAPIVEKPSVVIWGSTDYRQYSYPDSVNVNRYKDVACAPCNRPAPFTFDRNYRDRLDGEVVNFECPHRTCLKSISAGEVFSYVKSRIIQSLDHT